MTQEDDRARAEQEWETANGDYLACTLRWLRLRLELAALDAKDNAPLPEPHPGATTPPTTPPPTARQRSWWRRSPATTAETNDASSPKSTPLALPPVTRASLLEQIDEASRERDARAAAISPPPALLVLAERLGLSPFERDLLALCSAPELDPGIGELLSRAAGGGTPYPNFALAFSALDDVSWDAVSPERPLRYWRLIEFAGGGGGALTASALRTDERIVNYLKGLNHLDGRLTPLLAPFDDQRPAIAVTGSQQGVVDQLGFVIDDTPAAGRPPVVNLVGGDRSSKQLVARQTATRFGLDLLRLPVALLPGDADSLDLLTRLWQRECALLPVALYLDAHELESLARPDHDVPPLSRFLARSAGLVFLDSREQWDGLAASTVVAEVAKPTPSEQRTAWEAHLPDEEHQTASTLAAQFNLNLATIESIASSAQRNAAAQRGALRDQVWAGCLAATRPGLDRLATRIEPRAGWQDLVLGQEELALLHEIVAQVRRRARVYDEWGFRERMNRGLGVSALFAGDSGVGKTMAAEVIAGDLRLGLYRIDLSAVVSKYIGETEKNLRSVFDAAEGGGAILLFDEADALFGKRSEVKDSHDRYANIEVNYLLQRMEAYCGLAILATNAKAMLDTAFLRRLRFVVDFPFPGTAARREIWRRAFPARTPLDPDLDFDRLSRLVLTGGSIHNVALNASFLAAQDRTAVTMPLLLRATRNEFKKLGRPINESDFAYETPRVMSASDVPAHIGAGA